MADVTVMSGDVWGCLDSVDGGEVGSLADVGGEREESNGNLGGGRLLSLFT